MGFFSSIKQIQKFMKELQKELRDLFILQTSKNILGKIKTSCLGINTNHFNNVKGNFKTIIIRIKKIIILIIKP